MVDLTSKPKRFSSIVYSHCPAELYTKVKNEIESMLMDQALALDSLNGLELVKQFNSNWGGFQNALTVLNDVLYTMNSNFNVIEDESQIYRHAETIYEMGLWAYHNFVLQHANIKEDIKNCVRKLILRDREGDSSGIPIITGIVRCFIQMGEYEKTLEQSLLWDTRQYYCDLSNSFSGVLKTNQNGHSCICTENH